MGLPEIKIWTDGGLSGGNPGPGAAAAVLIYSGKVRIVCKALGHCTNNYAEVYAVLWALQALRRPCHITLYTDSKIYVLEGILRLLNGKMHKTHVGVWTAIKNHIVDGGHQIKVFHTYSHGSDQMNNMADAWAGFSADFQLDVDVSYDSVEIALSKTPWNNRKMRSAQSSKRNKQRRKNRT
jgi:ribonuclease HI